jgi:hypothetical protein
VCGRGAPVFLFEKVGFYVKIAIEHGGIRVQGYRKSAYSVRKHRYIWCFRCFLHRDHPWLYGRGAVGYKIRATGKLTESIIS